MKKPILLLAVIIFTAISINAQDLSLSWEGKTLGETVTIWGEPTASEMEFHAIVHNNSGNGMNIKVRRSQIEIVNGTINQFYWKVLYAPGIDESNNYVFVPDGGSTESTDFYGRYIPSSKNGTSTVEYTFYNKDNESQNVKVKVFYWASPDNIAEDAMTGGSISDIYPNPATNRVTLDYNLPSGLNSVEVNIVNLLGAVVKKAIATRENTKLTMDISELDAGVYFYTVLVSDEIYKTKKLIIRK